jgi:hypothetical protein
MKVQLPRGEGPVKSAKKYSKMTDNQKRVYDEVYDPINGPIFFAENCCWVNCNGIVQYIPFEYQREMLFNMHNSKNLISLFSRQNGKCFSSKINVLARNKTTGEIKEIPVGELFESIKNSKKI